VINDDSLKTVRAAHFKPNTVKPLYDSYCFSRIPGTIYNLLTGGNDPALPPSTLQGLPAQVNKVILLFVDAFGWRFFEKYSDQYPFLKRFITDGVVSKLTTQFPSTTAAHYTTIQTGLPIGIHGVYEGYYEPLVDRVIAPLMFSFSAGGSLLQTGIEPQEFCSKVNLHRRLREQGIKSYLFQDHDPYSDALAAGAHKIMPYRTFSEALSNLADAVLNEAGKAYYFMYFGYLDAIAHEYGPGSRPFEAEVDTWFNGLERLLHNQLKGQAKDTMLLVIADHGHTEISPETTLYLEDIAPSVIDLFNTNRAGNEKLFPVGSVRDMFLYIRPDSLEEAHATLTERLDGRAEVHYVKDLIAEGFFGSGEVSDVFLSHAADLVILPHDHESVWWLNGGQYRQTARGYHGGLSANEMETIFLALAY
jgi:hypothetical protein